MTKILLISPFPPAQNPRLLKEYRSLRAAGYQVSVIYGSRDKWAEKYMENNDDFIRIGGKIGSFSHLFSRLLLKGMKILRLTELTVNRLSIYLLLAARRHKADIYIGHNLAALPATVRAAKKNNALCIFDAEDFHRNETTDNKKEKIFLTAKWLEDRYLPELDFFTVSSPLIADAYKALYPSLNPIVITNVFSKKLVAKASPYVKEEQLKLFWFSQTIGKGRGISTVLEAMGILKNKDISLTLLGSVSPETKLHFEDRARKFGLNDDQLTFIAPQSPESLFVTASQFHIGLAIELTEPFNRQICLTNKIFTYITAGLAVICTETPAQKQLLSLFPEIGKSYQPDNSRQLASIIEHFFTHPDVLYHAQQAANNAAIQTLNSENEMAKYVDLIQYALSSPNHTSIETTAH